MQSTRYLTKLARQSDYEANFQLGFRLAFGRENSRLRPWNKIYKFWMIAASGGHVRAMFYIGTCYDHGYGVKQDFQSAFDWFLKAPKSGHRDAMRQLKELSFR